MTIDWDSLVFSYMDVNCHIRYTWKDGEWDAGELHDEPYMNIHMAATALHYGQSAFEGLKAFCCKDGKVRVFRLDENVKRMARSCRRIVMPEVSEAMFEDAIRRVVKANLDFVPPYGTGGSLYIRPVIFGSGPTIGVEPSKQYTFAILVMPVGDYYKGGLSPVRALVTDAYDRAAPRGVGNCKVGGNYASSLLPSKEAKSQDFPITLYLDAVEHRYIEEFGTSNFIAIKDQTYITPDSNSILHSITNKTLMTLAAENGLTVDCRRVAFEEIPEFDEVAACGTAVVITPVNTIVRGETVLEVGPREGCGAVLQNLYNQVRQIQKGELEDRWNWCRLID